MNTKILDDVLMDLALVAQTPSALQLTHCQVQTTGVGLELLLLYTYMLCCIP